MAFMSRATFSTCDKNAALYVNASCVVLMLLCSVLTKMNASMADVMTTTIERNAVLFSADTSPEALEVAARSPWKSLHP